MILGARGQGLGFSGTEFARKSFTSLNRREAQRSGFVTERTSNEVERMPELVRA